MKIDTIMIFAAGFGTRMGDVTKYIPKPLVQISGKPILYYAIENAIRHGFKRIIINSHYMADKIRKAVDDFRENTPSCPEIIVLYEDVILETGGGLKNALSFINNEDVFTTNSDVIIKSDRDFFYDMESRWDPKIMDMLLLLHPTDNTTGYTGNGDFEMTKEGKLALRPPGLNKYKYMNTGATIIKTSLVSSNKENKFSFLKYYNDDSTRIYGIENIGKFFHISTKEDMEKIDYIFSKDTF